MAEKNRRTYHRRRKRRSVLYGPVSFFIICIALVFGISVFFKVTRIEVTGNSIYTVDEIIDASSIEIGDNLFTISKFDAVSNIFTELPYVGEATITKTFPNKITIAVGESPGLACISDGSSYWLINKDCKILERVKGEDTAEYINIIGITVTNPEIGKQAEVADEEALKLEYLKVALSALNAKEMLENIAEIDISAVADLQFRYMDKYTVRLGANDSLEYKLDLLRSAMEQIGENELGTFDLTKDKEVHFIPES